MFTMVSENARRSAAAMAAVVVVSFAGLTLDQGHQGSLPAGTVEVGQLTPVDVMQMATVTLPEIVVIGQRIDESRLAAELPALPEITVTASREIGLASVPGRDATQG